jgi:GTPase SAR1 family protein
MNYEEYKLKRIELSDLVSNQKEISHDSKFDDVVNTSSKPTHELQIISTRLNDEQLRVLVMGKFSSGKSTFINGLIGEPLLPAKATPTTAVIGEIRYSENEEIILFPKKGKWVGGDEPFHIKREELNKYIIIDHTAENKVENPFEKVHIHWPLNICKHCIEFVDSPGLDDPDSHDKITLEYLPSADAIIYVMYAGMAYTALDKEIIEELRQLGHTSTIFVHTNYDRLIENDELTGSSDTTDVPELAYKTLKPLTDLGKDGIFFVNSVAAIRGKKTNSPDLLQSSNFPHVEEKIENILVNQKGRLKLFKSLYATKKINRENGRYMMDSVSVLKKDTEELKKSVREAKDPLNQAKIKGELIRSQVKNTISDLLSNAQDKSNLFLKDCISNIDNWLEEYTPEKGISANPLKLKSSIKEYTESCLKHVKSKMEAASKHWGDNELSPMIENGLQSLFRSMEEKIQAYNRDLLEVRIKLDIASEADAIAQKNNPSTFSRLAGVAYALITQDYISGAIGATLGIGGLMRTLAANLVAAIVLVIISFFTPVGIPAIIVGIVLASITGSGWTLLSIKKGIKKKISGAMKESLRSGEQKEKILLSIKGAVSEVLEKIQKEVGDAIDSDIGFYQKLLRDAETKFTEDNTTIQNKLRLYEQLIIRNDQLCGKLDEFGENIGMLN